MSSQKSSAQKVVIPKGMIDPTETTIIEIPSSMRKRNVVVVKKTENLSSVSSKKGSRSRKTHRATTTRHFNRKTDDMLLQNQNAGSSQSPGGSYHMLPKHPGLSHASFADFADDHQLDQLLEDLDRYYCTQKQMLINAKLSRTSTCPCPPNTKFTQTDVTIDNSKYESFKKGICPTKTSEPIATQLSVSAPQSQYSMKMDSGADKSCSSWNSAPVLKPHSSCSCSSSHGKLCKTTNQSGPHSQPLLSGQHLDSTSKMACCSKPEQQNFTIKSSPSKQSSCAILTPCDLELIRRQFEEASRKLQDILSSQKNDPSLLKKKKRY
ncbi:unnamed protein product [Phyllotreta striolata]|uniref:Uncharacterized protein n=1 Tax=Phyllotreta striolata TaxID=444603 RepID=A0A9N9XUF9_PHYSR|nr:unnamed protein product [Phyllotreta striolata]